MAYCQRAVVALVGDKEPGYEDDTEYRDYSGSVLLLLHATLW